MSDWIRDFKLVNGQKIRAMGPRLKSIGVLLGLLFIIEAIFILAACTDMAVREESGSVDKKIVTLPTATSEPTSTTAPTWTPTPQPQFDGSSAFSLLLRQMSFGPRWPGSEGHKLAGDDIVSHLHRAGWAVEEQRFPYNGLIGRNIIGRGNIGRGPVVILGAHYDSRKIADKTPGSSAPVPGAVDGASGVALLLELANVLDLDVVEREVWLAFFDMEDQGGGGMPGFDWIVGSTHMAMELETLPESMVLVDMIGDADQQLYYEGNSDPQLRAEIWHLAAKLGYGDYFIPVVRHTMIDDHLPFVRLGVPAIDIIDFDFPYHHTIEDTVDKSSSVSLLRVGRTLEVWLEEHVGKEQ